MVSYNPMPGGIVIPCDAIDFSRQAPYLVNLRATGALTTHRTAIVSNRSVPECVSIDSQLPAAEFSPPPEWGLVSCVGDLFQAFGVDHQQNITLILKFALEKTNGLFAVYRHFDYNRREQRTSQEVSAPKDFCHSGRLDGRICYEAFVTDNQSHLLVHDLSKTPYWDSDPDLERCQLKAYIGCPVIVSGKIIGSFALYSQRSGVFNASCVTLMNLLAAAIAVVEQHRLVVKGLRDKLRREKMLSEISISAVSNMKMEKFMAHCVELLGFSMAADGVSLFHQDEKAQTFKRSAHWGGNAESGKALWQNFGDLLSLSGVGDCIKRGDIFHCTDLDTLSDPELGKALRACKIKALLLLPLFNEEAFNGCFAMYRKDKLQPWSDEDIAVSGVLMKILGKRLNNRTVARRLDESEALNHQMFQLSPAAIYRIDFRNLRLLAVNDQLCTASGYTREELLSMDPTKMLTPKSLEVFFKRMQDIHDGKPVSENAEFEVVTKDGHIEWGRFHIQHIYEGDQIVGANVVAHFITEQRKAREALNDYRKNLESMVAARIADLAKANMALRDEITQRVHATEKLRASSERLKEMNTAMRVMLDKRMEDHQRTEELIRLNLKELIDPYLTRLENGELRGSQRQLVDLIRLNLDEVVASSMPELASKYFIFSPNELQVVNLIRKGKTSKEMARLLNLSTRTVESYRNSIRKKLDIKNKKVNLRTYLSSI